jgi:hypothetical protein
VGVVKRILSISCFLIAAASSCGNSVDLGGDKGDDDGPGGAGGDDGPGDDDGRTGGRSFGGVAGAFGGSGPAGGTHPAGNGAGGIAGDGIYPGGNGTGGIAGDYPSGAGGVAGDYPSGAGGVAGDYPSGAGGVAGDYPSGAGGVGGGPIPQGLPRCITDLYDTCWPHGECRGDAAKATRCYEFGVKIVTEPLPNSCGGSVERYYKADGTLCYSYMQGAIPEHACETAYRRWYGPDGALIAESARAYWNPPRPFSDPTCVGVPTVPCDIGAGGVGTHCQWPTDVCEPGECPYPATESGR